VFDGASPLLFEIEGVEANASNGSRSTGKPSIFGLNDGMSGKLAVCIWVVVVLRSQILYLDRAQLQDWDPVFATIELAIFKKLGTV